MTLDPQPVTPEQAGRTLAAVLRSRLPDLSWSQIHKLIEQRRVTIDGELCLDLARRLAEGESIALLAQPVPASSGSTVEELVLRHLDDHLVVVEKPSGINTVRHPAERDWSQRRRDRSPTLDDLTTIVIAQRLRVRKHTLARLRVVHRLDKHTSGLVVFARTVRAESELGRQFAAHTVTRRYLAVIPGYLPTQRIESTLVRDRGDGRRGSGTRDSAGKVAVTHIDVVERFGDYTLLACRLETGRTHQIRIHLAEAGHPVCGETVYHRQPSGDEVADQSGAPRLALHAAELGFVHPVTGEAMHWAMELSEDLRGWLEGLRATQQGEGSPN